MGTASMLSVALRLQGLILKPVPVRSVKMTTNCIFCKIVNKEAPSNILHEDERFVVFPDISPAAKNHLLLIPKEHIVDVRALTRDDIPMVRDMEVLGIKVLRENGGDS